MFIIRDIIKYIQDVSWYIILRSRFSDNYFLLFIVHLL